jgi:hypothetical protein
VGNELESMEGLNFVDHLGDKVMVEIKMERGRQIQEIFKK